MIVGDLTNTIMKFVLPLSLFFSALFISGCATTTEEPAPSVAEEPAAVEPVDSSSILLMDRYKSGEIPGYRE